MKRKAKTRILYAKIEYVSGEPWTVEVSMPHAKADSQLEFMVLVRSHFPGEKVRFVEGKRPKAKR